MRTVSGLWALGVAVAAALALGAPAGAVRAADSARPEPPPALADLALPDDAPIEPWRADLLELAFDTAGALPLNPHVKNRARALQSVVTACLELDQPRRAMRILHGIPNWRRGLACGNVALYCARHGHTEPVLPLLNAAATHAAERELLAWRRDSILAKIAQARAWAEKAETEGGAPADGGDEALPAPAAMDDAAFEARLKEIEALVQTADLDAVRKAVETATPLMGDVWDVAARRDRVEQVIRDSLRALPPILRVQSLRRLALVAAEKGDTAKAQGFLGEGFAIVDASRWIPEYRLRMAAELCEAQARAGGAAGAKRRADAIRKDFERDVEKIVNMFRGNVLRPLAEAYQAMGKTETARAVYGDALTQAVVNINSRPRAMDLVAICCSMARHGVEPDEALWARLREVREGLGHPW